MVTVVWDTWLKAGTEVEGLRLTRQVWSDMRGFEGYISHQILVDQDAPGHIIALARWRTREDTVLAREEYKDSETIRQLTPLLARPRERWVTSEDEPTAAESGAAPGCEQLRRQLENERWDRFLNFTPEVPTEVTV